MTKEHLNRKSNIGSWALPPKGTRARQEFEDFLTEKRKDPEFQKSLKKLHKKAVARISAQAHNGMNNPIDKELRWFLTEYNNRNMNFGLNSMPLNFNIMEAFFDHNPSAASFALKDETDYLVSFIDFYEYFTSPLCEFELNDLICEMEEHTIYSYTNLDEIDAFTFSTEGKKEYALAGFSMIRDGNEICAILLCGQKGDTKEETKKLLKHKLDIDNLNLGHPDKEGLKPDETLKVEAVPLLGNDSYWKCLALTRIDLTTATIDARYLMSDCGQSFHVITDDPQGFLNDYGEFNYKENKEVYETYLNEMKSYHAVFETIKTLLMLPVYFDKFSEDIKTERHITELGKNKHTHTWRKKINLLSKNQKVYYRNLIVLDPRCKQYPTKSSFFTPDIKVETKGFWKTLSPGSIGKDKNGDEIHGKTWVTQNLSWFENDSPSSIFNITKNETTVEGNSSGIIYFMRCAAHGKDVFKIGLTKRTSDIRSNELSRSTSSPDNFLVAQEWEVNDCILAEKLIHERLNAYRINPKREFFQVDYKIVFNHMHEIVEIVNNKDKPPLNDYKK